MTRTSLVEFHIWREMAYIGGMKSIYLPAILLLLLLLPQISQACPDFTGWYQIENTKNVIYLEQQDCYLLNQINYITTDSGTYEDGHFAHHLDGRFYQDSENSNAWESWQFNADGELLVSEGISNGGSILESNVAFKWFLDSRRNLISQRAVYPNHGLPNSQVGWAPWMKANRRL